MNTDKYLNRIYNKREYNCAHFVAEVWHDLTGHDLSIQLTGFMRKRSDRFVTAGLLKSFIKLPSPKTPSILWLHNKKESHVGIYLDGRVLHITENGVKLELLETLTIGFKKVGFYDVKNFK